MDAPWTRRWKCQPWAQQPPEAGVVSRSQRAAGCDVLQQALRAVAQQPRRIRTVRAGLEFLTWDGLKCIIESSLSALSTRPRHESLMQRSFGTIFIIRFNISKKGSPRRAHDSLCCMSMTGDAESMRHQLQLPLGRADIALHCGPDSTSAPPAEDPLSSCSTLNARAVRGKTAECRQ